MASVFISYARDDRDYAQRLCDALRARGVDVWWDFDLKGGEDFRHRINGVIDGAERVIVLWSEQSVKSHFVIDEAGEAKRLGKLVPLSIDGVSAPLGFRGLHTIRVRDLDQDLDIIIASVNASAGTAESVDRKRTEAIVPQPRPNRRKVIALAAGAGVAVAGGSLAGYRLWPQPMPSKTAENAEPPPAEARGVDFSVSRRTALVIGNSEYDAVERMTNPPRDATSVAEALEKRGFRVVLMTNVSEEAMIDAFRDFESTLSVVGGVGLFYYAGHAVHIEGVDLLFPVDVKYDVRAKEIKGAVDLTDLLQKISAKTTQSFSDDGNAVLFSASKGEFAGEGPPNTNSPFAMAFLDTLETSHGDLSDFYRNLTRTMSENAKTLEMERAVTTRGVAPLAARRKVPVTWSQRPVIEDARTKAFDFNDPSLDADIGVMKILVLDSCRDNPFGAEVSSR